MFRVFRILLQFPKPRHTFLVAAVTVDCTMASVLLSAFPPFPSTTGFLGGLSWAGGGGGSSELLVGGDSSKGLWRLSSRAVCAVCRVSGGYGVHAVWYGTQPWLAMARE